MIPALLYFQKSFVPSPRNCSVPPFEKERNCSFPLFEKEGLGEIFKINPPQSPFFKGGGE
jgi:hypothetical protein